MCTSQHCVAVRGHLQVSDLSFQHVGPRVELGSSGLMASTFPCRATPVPCDLGYWEVRGGRNTKSAPSQTCVRKPRGGAILTTGL